MYNFRLNYSCNIADNTEVMVFDCELVLKCNVSNSRFDSNYVPQCIFKKGVTGTKPSFSGRLLQLLSLLINHCLL